MNEFINTFIKTKKIKEIYKEFYKTKENKRKL